MKNQFDWILLAIVIGILCMGFLAIVIKNVWFAIVFVVLSTIAAIAYFIYNARR